MTNYREKIKKLDERRDYLARREREFRKIETAGFMVAITCFTVASFLGALATLIAKL